LFIHSLDVPILKFCNCSCYFAAVEISLKSEKIYYESSSPIKLFSACIESSKDLSVRSYLVHTLLVLILEMVLLLLLCIWFIVINSLQMTEILGKVNMKSKPKKVQWFQIVFGAVLLSLRLTRQTKKL